MPNLIDRVEVGDLVDIRFSNFSLTPLLVVPGKVSSISTDVLFKDKTKEPYYLARVSLTERGNEYAREEEDATRYGGWCSCKNWF